MTLAELIARQKDKAKNVEIDAVDWRLRRDKWLAELDGTLQRIEAWLRQSGMSEDEIEHFSLEINEETLGRYTATGLRVQIGAAVVTFRPIGSVLIGACGRIDVVSDQPGTPSVKLIAECTPSSDDSGHRSSHERDWGWLVYLGRGVKASFPLDQEGLAKLLAIVLGEEMLS
ncbi:hypothetical protein [Aquaspirillum serpens]|uniref:hypothetical protein n=1 Tax=Aquaspirillum serpens TaxID=190 RepID=UPI0003B3B06C|nr:hypothetical protein [Aquaspirillum serpens]